MPNYKLRFIILITLALLCFIISLGIGRLGITPYEVIRTLFSGIIPFEQMNDNLNTFAADNALNEEDMKTLINAAETWHKNLLVPCTGCCYCTEGCPMSINIPEWLKVYNAYKTVGSSKGKELAAEITQGGRPEDCVQCGNCTGHCPQNINTPEIMEKLAELLK